MLTTTKKRPVISEADLPTSEQLAKDLGSVATIIEEEPPKDSVPVNHKHKPCGTFTRIGDLRHGNLARCNYCNSWFPLSEFE